MTSSRLLLPLIVIFIIVLAFIASGRILSSLRERVFQKPISGKVSDAVISVTPTKAIVFSGSEIPNTGPVEITYLLLSGGFISGLLIRRK